MQNLPADKARIRKREVTDAFLRLIAFARAEDVQVVVIAGDFFDGKKIAASLQKEVFDAIGGLPAVDFLYLAGNHDSRAVFEGGARPPNLKLFDGGAEWTCFDYGDVRIAGLELGLQAGYACYEKLRFDKPPFNIAVLHGDLKTIAPDKLRGKNIDYLALGDCHSPDLEPKKLDARGWYAYSGCLEGRGFDEAGEKGFFVLEIQNGAMRRRFVPAAKRRYELVEVDITALDTHAKIDAAVREKTEAIGGENIVRVTLRGKRGADAQIERDNLEGKLQERFFYAQLKDGSALDMASVSFENELSLRGEFVRLVKESDLPPAQKETILEYGIKALRGEAAEV